MNFAPNTTSLVADIGGTNTRVALTRGPELLTDTVRKYPNVDHPGLEAVIRTFVADMGGVDVLGASVAVAGPVRDGRGTLTNLDWTIDRETLAAATGAEVTTILNDLQAQGHAIKHLPDGATETVIEGAQAIPNGVKLVIGVGTGFNAAVVFDTDDGTLVPPSEAGHANLPIRNEAELRLCQYVETAHGFPAVEDVLSGRGLERVYAWLGSEAGDLREIRAADIMAGLESGNDPRAKDAARIFTKILGTVAGNLSLIHLPFGGVYLIGGVSRAFGPHLREFAFADAFRDKGRFAGFMGNFSVDIVADDYAALIGSAAHLHKLVEKRT